MVNAIVLFQQVLTLNASYNRRDLKYPIPLTLDADGLPNVSRVRRLGWSKKKEKKVVPDAGFDTALKASWFTSHPSLPFTPL